MKKIRKTLAGIIALSMLTSNSVYISAAEKSKSEDNSPSVISASKKDAPKLNERIKQLEDSGLSISEILDCLAADGTWGQVAVMFKVKPGAEIPKLKEYHYIQQYWEDDAYIIESLPEDLKEYVELDIVEKAEFWFPPTSGAAARAERAKEYRWLFKNGGYTEDTYIFLEFSDGFDINEVLLPDSEMYNTYTMANDVVYYIHASEEVMNQYIDWYENYEGEDLKAFFIDRPTVPVNETDDPAEPAVPVNNDKDNVKAGDIFADDKIDVTDLTELSLALLGDRNLSEDQKKAADVDGDGDVTLADLAMLRQYLSKKIDSLGKTPNASIPSPAVTSDITDISDSCETVTVGVDVDKWGSALKSIMISSMEDYDEYIGVESEENKKLAKKGIEINEEFFKTNRLAVMVDNSEGCNGVKYTLTGVKLDKDGNVHLYYDKEIPEFMTALASVFHYITVVPASENSESETIVHFNEIRERTYITDKCTIVNSTNVGFKGGSYPVVSGMITSMEQFEEEMSKNGIEPAGVIERLDISKEFFDDNFLVYQTLYSGNTNPKSWIYRLSFDKENNLRMDYITYTTVHYYEDGTKVSVGGEQMVYRMLAAAVPKSVIDPSDVTSFVSNGHSHEGENGYRIINQINEKSVKSASKTEVESKGNTVNISLIDSMEGFERINDLYDGKYNHIKDELLTDNFFKDNVLYIADQPSVKKNIEYKIEDLMVKSNGVLEVTVGTSINNDEPDEDDNTEWHLAAAIPRSELVFDNINADTKIQ
ncbi:MAG: dockerin type I repeat-containing protein [Oscillospiraceae bacterium]|nr:dockerin type I repeat-containing protein [Oscillospiraceae bacterium]